jgi:hypothetical protein
MLSELNEDLLKDAEIIEIVYDERAGLLIDFKTRKADEFDGNKSRINDSGRFEIEERGEREAVDRETYRIQIAVTFSAGRAGGDAAGGDA